MKVLILGSGAREHALALAIAKSPRSSGFLSRPEIPAARRSATLVSLNIVNSAEIVEFCKANAIDLVVVGPEAPLVAGVADDLAAAGIACFGPSRAAAQLEGSKGFTKDFCREFGMPTGDYADSAIATPRSTMSPRRARRSSSRRTDWPRARASSSRWTLAEAEAAMNSMFDGAFGAAGAEVVVEEFLRGEEASFFAISDGDARDRLRQRTGSQARRRRRHGPEHRRHGRLFAAARDDARRSSERVMREIVEPTVAGMAARGTPFRGVLFAGLMIGDGRSEADRIQRPFRRSRGGSDPGAARRRPARVSLGRRDRRAAGAGAEVLAADARWL